MTSGERPDFSELLQSPYDPEPAPGGAEGSTDLDWRAPVLAAIVGALLVSAFVIFAIVTGPDDASEAIEITTTTTSPPVEPVQSTSVPAGFVQATEQVGFRVESYSAGPHLHMAISSASVGGMDSALVEPADVAYWSIDSDSGEVVMANQLGATGALGNHMVSFDVETLPRSATVLGYPAVGEFTVSELLNLEPGPLPMEVVGHTIDLGADRTVTIERLVIGDGWGHIEWSASGTSAKVDAIVTFVGTDDRSTEDVDPTLLTPSHLRPITPVSGPRSLPPFYNFFDSDQLTRSGEPLSGVNEATGIEVSLTVTVPASVGPAFTLPIPSSP